MLQYAVAPSSCRKYLLAVSQLFDLVHCQRYGAVIRFDALVDESVDAHTKIMIGIILSLAWR